MYENCEERDYVWLKYLLYIILVVIEFLCGSNNLKLMITCVYCFVMNIKIIKKLLAYQLILFCDPII